MSRKLKEKHGDQFVSLNFLSVVLLNLFDLITRMILEFTFGQRLFRQCNECGSKDQGRNITCKYKY